LCGFTELDFWFWRENGGKICEIMALWGLYCTCEKYGILLHFDTIFDLEPIIDVCKVLSLIALP
jgi:hypothetical protein